MIKDKKSLSTLLGKWRQATAWKWVGPPLLDVVSLAPFDR